MAKKNRSIIACLIERGIYKKLKEKKKKRVLQVKQRNFLKSLLKSCKKNTRIISSTGYNSRELIYIRKNIKLKIVKTFIWLVAWAIHHL